MARIKTIKYDFNGKDIAVNFNCNSSGRFSTNLHVTIQKLLGLEGRLESDELSNLEKIIGTAFTKYKEANTAYTLKIGITFGAGGEFKKLPSGEDNIKFYPQNNNTHSISVSMSRGNSCIAFDFRVLIEENRDGKITYWETHPQNGKLDHFYNDHKVIEGYYKTQSLWGVPSEETLIAYSVESLQTLETIQTSFRKASAFIMALITSDQIENILQSGAMTALMQNNGN